ncbi:MAG: ROK family protein [Rhodobacteraceae bacterium]|nr:ROK family protein [Paracoccaceae bacterium]
MSRADLARALRLNRSSSGNIIANLLNHGLVREVEDGEFNPTGRAGRPGILLELVGEAVSFLGVEIGVEHIAVVELDFAGKAVRTVQQPFDGQVRDPGLAVEQAVKLALNTLPTGRRDRCEGLGIATPSQMDMHGRIRLTPLLGWRDVDLAAIVRESLPAPWPVMVENEANAFAIGAVHGRGVGRHGVTLLVNMECGLGGGILVAGQLLRGGNGLAGEIGHLRLGLEAGPEGPILERRIGLGQLIADYRSQSGRPHAKLADLIRDVGDRVPEAVAVADDWARTLAFALSQACRIIDPDTIVLGGSVAGLHSLVATRVLKHLRAITEESFPLPRIEIPDDIGFGAAYGAACMMHQRFLMGGDEWGSSAGI